MTVAAMAAMPASISGQPSVPARTVEWPVYDGSNASYRSSSRSAFATPDPKIMADQS